MVCVSFSCDIISLILIKEYNTKKVVVYSNFDGGLKFVWSRQISPIV